MKKFISLIAPSDIMPIRALATDYDGTIAHHGAVPQSTLNALQRLKHAGFKLILVTGRELHDLASIFPQLAWFDLAVMENGALLFRPENNESEPLAKKAPTEFVGRLYDLGLPFHVGKIIIATWEPHEKEVLETIKEFALDLQVIFNKGAVMILPSGVNKATGLRHAAERLGLDVSEIAGVGDAENDHPFLEICGLSAAPANALPVIKQKVQFVAKRDHGHGVEELVEHLLAGMEVAS